jgi:hypothetical protein
MTPLVPREGQRAVKPRAGGARRLVPAVLTMVPGGLLVVLAVAALVLAGLIHRFAFGDTTPGIVIVLAFAG